MLIILEGPDLAGKSTLAARLQTYLAVKYPHHTVTLLHRGPPTQHPLFEYVEPLLRYRPGGNEHIIIDRWHVGEVVYPRILNRPTQLTPAVYRWINMFLQARGALIVHVSAADDELRRRYAERGDDSRSLSEVLAASQQFHRTMFELLPYANLQPWHESPTLVDEIVSIAANREALTTHTRQLTTYVGSPYPRTLYVGDQRACRAKSWRCGHIDRACAWWPSFGPFPGTSGEFLMRALIPGTCGLVNVNDVDDIGPLFGSYDRPNYVVALGRAAQRALEKMGVKHTAVPHPQYVRRFHHHELATYRLLLTHRDNGDHVRWTPPTS